MESAPCPPVPPRFDVPEKLRWDGFAGIPSIPAIVKSYPVQSRPERMRCLHVVDIICSDRCAGQATGQFQHLAQKWIKHALACIWWGSCTVHYHMVRFRFVREE